MRIGQVIGANGIFQLPLFDGFASIIVAARKSCRCSQQRNESPGCAKVYGLSRQPAPKDSMSVMVRSFLDTPWPSSIDHQAESTPSAVAGEVVLSGKFLMMAPAGVPSKFFLDDAGRVGKTASRKTVTEMARAGLPPGATSRSEVRWRVALAALYVPAHLMAPALQAKSFSVKGVLGPRRVEMMGQKEVPSFC